MRQNRVTANGLVIRVTIRTLGPLLPTDIVQRFALVHAFSILQMLTMAADLLDHAMPALSIGNVITDFHSFIVQTNSPEVLRCLSARAVSTTNGMDSRLSPCLLDWA